MEVTNENFEEVLPLIEESIRNADFIAFDAEFSGKNQQDHSICKQSVLRLLQAD